MGRGSIHGPEVSVPARHATLSDLLDRILSKGLILDADVVIALAGIPLIGVKLRAAIAGMETMRRYGLMEELDTKIRDQYQSTPPIPQEFGVRHSGSRDR